MLKKINRRTFVTTTLCGLGGMTFGSEVSPLLQNPNFSSLNRDAKKLIATTDYVDNIINNDRETQYGAPSIRSSDYYENHLCFMDRKQLDGLHKFLADIGVTRHQWIVNTIWTLYEDYPHGFDLLEEAAKSAHKYGIEFYAEIKPFEGGGIVDILPHSMPCPDGIAYRDLRGIIPLALPFVATHPGLNLQRRPGTYECTEPVSAIRLVKNDDNPTRIKAEHLSIWTSPTNNGFISYAGPVSFRETIEPRNKFPYWKQCRILHLEDLKISGDHRYILIRCTFADGMGDFSNEKGNILELVGSDGKILPHSLSTGPVSLDEHDEKFYQSRVMRQLVRYLQKPEVLAEINNRQKMKGHYRDFYSFGDYNLATLMTFDKDGYVAVACGKPEYIYGNLHPLYPEVREHFLDLTRFCLDRGVDGINFRVANHVLSPESWEYGFNEPAIMASAGKTDYPTISKINGNAYTLFLREAREIIKKQGKKIAVHLNSDMLFPDDRPGKLTALPYNFEWQWETWVKEIADELEFRGIFKLRPWHLQQALDIFSHVTRKAGKPFYLQGDFHGMTYDGPFARTEAEINLVNNHPGLDGYVLYETANFTRISESGEIEGSPEIFKIINDHFLKRRPPKYVPGAYF